MADFADGIARDVLSWVHSVLPETDVAAQGLGARARANGVDLRLLSVSPRPAPRTQNPPDIIDLDFLLTVQLPDPYEEARALGELLLSAARRSDIQVVSGASGAEICARLGVPVAAGFVVRTPLERAREIKAAPLVRFPLKVDTTDIGVLAGVVVGPNAVPVSGALVTIADIGRSAATDAAGRFRIHGVPHGNQEIKINVRARGVECQSTARAGSDLVVQLPVEA